MNNIKKLLKAISFIPKENASDIYIKKYQDDYSIEVDFKSLIIDFGSKIKSDSKTTQNFSQPENWVVLECVNRLLEKGYKPENIILEKTYPAGHGHSGRLDICVNRDNEDNEYLLIECKTYGKEFEKEFNNLKKNGGQLFTYFKFSNKADLIMLYTSDLIGEKIDYISEIIKIEEDYRTGDVKDFYEKWNKFTKDNGVFESWVNPYNFVSKALTLEQLKPIEQEDSSFIFNRFLEILRHNVVSDKPNAFNKIFTLFLCKVYDEKSKLENEELDFQWMEGQDDDVSFQIRLTEIYKKGMKDFLDKTVSDFSKEDFEKEYAELNEDIKKQLLERIYKLRLEKNNEFAFKEVFDNQSFKENAKIVKEIVELLQGYRLRYNKRQQYLSDFFELLLTTGLKQESGQFFTPVPISQFIIKSLPLDKIIDEKLNSRDNDNLLPYVIDYAAGSGHFLTESMHEIQNIIDSKNHEDYIRETGNSIHNWQRSHFDWATKYIYGIEKDYRLVKVGKVGCYLHGDGLANVILSDGLSNFHNKEYKGILKQSDPTFPKENKKFDIVVSNPPYSVSAFKNASREYYNENDFELYNSLSDFSSEIEVLFIERTQQLLKDGGVAGIILPSSILSNSGSYSKAREIILKFFDIVAITELGSNTFMATGTNTVVLFLKRKDNYISINLKKSVDNFFNNYQNVTLLGIEKPISKYINHTWENINFEDYISLIQNNPNENIINNELFIEYKSKIKHKNETDLFNKINEIEKEKIFYFILAYNQKVVVVKSGSKQDEKKFLGYEFSFRRGSEGIHPIQRGKTISECTKLFDENTFTNPEKASTYIYNAFKNNFDLEVNETLKNNIFYQDLIDLLTFDRSEFQNNINLSIKKKVKIESKWELKKLGVISVIDYGTRIVKKTEQGSIYPVYGGGGETFKSDNFNRENTFIISRFGMSPKCVRYISRKFFLNDSGLTLNSADSNILNPNYLNQFLFLNQEMVYLCGQGVAQKNLEIETFNSLKIPLPPLEIQEKIVSEIEVLEKREEEIIVNINELKDNIFNYNFNKYNNNEPIKLKEIAFFKRGPFGGSLKKEIFVNEGYKVYEQQHAIKNNFEIGKYFVDESKYNEMLGFSLVPGDIIMSCSGTIGKLAIFPENAKPGIINQALLRFRPNKLKTTTEYLNIILTKINEDFIENSHGTGLKNVASVKILKEINVFCPPLEIQEKIVKEIEKLKNEINIFEKELKEIPKQKEEILQKYL